MRVLVVVRIQVVSGSVEEVDGVNSRCTAVVGCGEGHVAGADGCCVKFCVCAVGPAGKRITVAVVGIVILNSGGFDDVAEVAGDGCGFLNLTVIIIVKVDIVFNIMLLEYRNIFRIITDNEGGRILRGIGNHGTVVIKASFVDDIIRCTDFRSPTHELVGVGGICRLGRLGCRHDNVVSVMIGDFFAFFVTSRNIFSVCIIERNGVRYRRIGHSGKLGNKYRVAFHNCTEILIFDIFIGLAIKILRRINLPTFESHFCAGGCINRIFVAVKHTS